LDENRLRDCKVSLIHQCGKILYPDGDFYSNNEIENYIAEYLSEIHNEICMSEDFDDILDDIRIMKENEWTQEYQRYYTEIKMKMIDTVDDALDDLYWMCQKYAFGLEMKMEQDAIIDFDAERLAHFNKDIAPILDVYIHTRLPGKAMITAKEIYRLW
jgi:hypothetical protein